MWRWLCHPQGRRRGHHPCGQHRAAETALADNTNEVGGGLIMKLLFEGLISYDAQGRSINQVAESITTTDSQTFTIKLKPGWKFTNDEPVDAKSFVDAWNFGALITNAQLNAYFFEPIDGYTKVHPAADGAKPTATATTMKGLAVVDDSTFTARLTSAQASFPMRLGYTAFYPLPQSAYKDIKAFGQSPVGNGSYMMDGKWVHNVSIKDVVHPLAVHHVGAVADRALTERLDVLVGELGERVERGVAQAHRERGLRRGQPGRDGGVVDDRQALHGRGRRLGAICCRCLLYTSPS